MALYQNTILCLTGINFGRQPIPFSDSFYEIHKAWCTKEIPLRKAVDLCGLKFGIFYDKARKFEKSD